MRYTLQKIVAVFTGGIFMALGGGLAAYNFIIQYDLLMIALGSAFFLVGLLATIFKVRQLSRFQKMNYSWYKQTYPEQVAGHQVSCFVCGNNRIQVRALLQQTYHREHFCPQCGKTLYYSPEQA